MNFLAHIYLSGNSEKLTIGNFIADSVKGKQYLDYDEEIAKGIQLHREIDEYTDTHPIVNKSVERLYETQKKYASVVVDIFYDHFLARKWDDFHAMDLKSFSEQFYKILQKYHEILPKRIQNFMPYMIRQNWLYNYHKIEGMEQVFEGMSSRTKFASNMLSATKDLRNYYQDFEKEFDLFFPELIDFVTQRLK